MTTASRKTRCVARRTRAVAPQSDGRSGVHPSALWARVESRGRADVGRNCIGASTSKVAVHHQTHCTAFVTLFTPDPTSPESKRPSYLAACPTGGAEPECWGKCLLRSISLPPAPMLSKRPSKSQAPAPALSLLIVALKVAREATDDVPIVKQILGAAVHIVQFAEVQQHTPAARLAHRSHPLQKTSKGDDALRALAEKAALFAQQIQQVVAGRSMEQRLAARLRRLTECVFSGAIAGAGASCGRLAGFLGPSRSS